MIIIRSLNTDLPSLQTRPLGFGLACGGGGSGGMMTTVLRKHNQQYHHKSRNTRYLQYFRDVVLSYIVATPTSGLSVLNVGVSNGLRRGLEIGWGQPFFGDDHDTLSRTHHSPQKSKSKIRSKLDKSTVRLHKMILHDESAVDTE